MSVREFPIETVGLEYICDACGNCAVVQKGNVDWLSQPPKFPHECPECGATCVLDIPYPTTAYRRIDPKSKATQ